MLASIGVPGLNGFVGEFLILAGTFLTHRWWAVVATVGRRPRRGLPPLGLPAGLPRPSRAPARTRPFAEITWREAARDGAARRADRLPRRLPEAGARPDHPVGRPARRPRRARSAHAKIPVGRASRCVTPERQAGADGDDLEPAGGGGLALPHIDYTAILPELILLGGMLAAARVSALIAAPAADRVPTPRRPSASASRRSSPRSSSGTTSTAHGALHDGRPLDRRRRLRGLLPRARLVRCSIVAADARAPATCAARASRAASTTCWR